MASALLLLGLGTAAFTTTNVDNLLCLLGFFASRDTRGWQVVAGQFTGMMVLIGLSFAGAFAALTVAPQWTALLGLIPFSLGVFRLAAHRPQNADTASVVRPGALAAGPGRGIGGVALVTISNGGDNVATYIPLFSSHGLATAGMLAALFLVLTGAWCAAAYSLVRHPRVGVGVQRYAQKYLGVVLILLGLCVLSRLPVCRL